MPLYGLDVSEHNNGLNLHTAQQEGYDFAIIRICDGTYTDPIFHSHLKDAETAGLITSGYWYLRAPPKEPPSPNKSTPSTNNYKAAKTSPSG
ncbi:GH25 family lysozyme [Corynebacterium sp. MSK204]|uniref:GH25 family lysozyme n=1 Tax=Corynebacterium sp. MSK204 TaxID=3050217 RepID=UPI00254F52DB|nr:GH25 family lysozyme [Corynebacterium sp. MSK204]MDK8660316.1 GH25 family lysozyme [Corynebacterium sp. MSK204]